MMPPVILITRPEPQATLLAEGLGAAHPGLRIVISPLQRIVFAPVLPMPAGGARLIFTSRNGVIAWARAGGGPRRAYCVGDGTAAAAAEAGHTALSAHGTAEDLLALILRERPRVPLLHLRGAHHRGALSDRLVEAGLDARAAEAYRQQPLGFTAEACQVMQGADPVIAPLYSPRSARLFVAGWRGQAPLHLTAISETTASVLRAAMSEAADADRPELTHFSARSVKTLCTADHPDGAAMFRALSGLLVAVHQLETGKATD